MTEQNKPKQTFRAGGVSSTIWENKTEDASTYLTFNVERSYKDKNDQWQKTNSYGANDLAKLKLVVDKTTEYILLKKDE